MSKNYKQYFPWEDVVACRNSGRDDSTGILKPSGELCKTCGNPIERFYFKSPDWTWEEMCGRAGWMEACFVCRKQLKFELGIMN